MPGTAPAPAHAGPARVGRPRDPGATARVLTATQHLLATQGASITAEAIAAQAGVGKATIYRRWTTLVDVLVDAVLATDPLPAAPTSPGSTRAQLSELLHRLCEPLSADERTVAAALVQSGWQPRLHDAVEEVLLAPLRERVEAACSSTGTARESDVRTLISVVEGLWVRRYLLTATPLRQAEVCRVVDDAVRGLEPLPDR